MPSLSRRGFLAGLIAAAVAPAIIRTPGLIMPIKPALTTGPYVIDTTAGPITMQFPTPELTEETLRLTLVSIHRRYGASLFPRRMFVAPQFRELFTKASP